MRKLPLKNKKIPKDYSQLVSILPPRPIHDKVDYKNAIEIIDWMAGHDLNTDQEDYLEAISIFIENYEKDNVRLSLKKQTGIKALISILKDHGMSKTDFANLLKLHRSMGGKILSGERMLTTNHLKILSKKFKVNPSLFI